MDYNYYKNLINNKQKRHKIYYTNAKSEKMKIEITIIRKN